MTPCNHHECTEHPDVVVATKVNKIILICFGTLGTFLVTLLITVATLSFNDLKEYKEDSLIQDLEMRQLITSNNEASLKRDTRTQVALSNITNRVNNTDGKLDSLTEGMTDIKQILQKSSTFAAKPTPNSSILLSMDY